MANQHAYTGPAVPQIEEPSHAERVRTLFSLANTGTLATWSKKVEGFPFGSLMPYALDDAGRALFLISNMAMHTQNVKADPRASLFVTQTAEGGDVLGAARATLVGNVLAVPAEETAAARERYLAAHEGSRYWVDFSDFGFFRLTPIEIYYVGGFGVMGWVNAEEYARATADPLAGASAGILQHMNADHGAAMVTLAARYAGLSGTEAQMTGVDRLGFTLRVKTAEGMKGARINFPGEVRSGEETRGALVGMLRAS
jgi:putative heme iron utilization protein